MFQSNKYLAFAVVLVLSIATSTLFMNCGSGSLPAAANGGNFSSSSKVSLQASFNPNPAYVGDPITLTGTYGTPPYSYRIISGSGVLTGNTYQSPASQETADIRITDASGSFADVMVTFQSKTAAIVVTPGTASYSNPGSFDFAIPPYNSLTVEVWGGGGGGQICTWFSGCSNGSAGGDSLFDVLKGGGGSNLSPGVGVGGDVNSSGETGNWSGTNNCGLGGSSGGPLGTATRDGKFPGGGGDAQCNLVGANGGGGGGYARKTYAPGTLPVGSVISGKVGAAGSVSAAGGQVRFSWQ